MNIIIGITGKLGAGKGTIAEFLVKAGFEHFSVGDYLAEEVSKKGMPMNRDSMVAVANGLRAKHSPSFIAEKLYQKARTKNKNCVIESLRTEGEINSLKNNPGFFLFAVDADPKARYERIAKRGGSKDKVSFEKFIEQEKAEMSSSDPNKQNLSKCISMADYAFDNNGTIQDLHKKVEKVLKEIEVPK